MVHWTVLTGIAGSVMISLGLLGKFAAGMASSGTPETPGATKLIIAGAAVVAVSVAL